MRSNLEPSRRQLVSHLVRGKTLVDFGSEPHSLPCQFLLEEQQRRRQAAEAFRRGEIERRLQPRTAADFDILYGELEAWRMQVCS